MDYIADRETVLQAVEAVGDLMAAALMGEPLGGLVATILEPLAEDVALAHARGLDG